MGTLFEIIFEDNTAIKFGNYVNTGWKDIPDKPIRVIFYLLPTGDHLCLFGYEKYYHMIEVCQDIYGSSDSKVRLEYAYLFAALKDKVNIYKICLSTGNIEFKQVDITDSFVSKLNQNFWKKGIVKEDK